MPQPSFPIRFREARQGKRLTQMAVAKVLGVSQSAVAQWESGRSFPSASLASPIKQLLDVEIRLAEGGQQPQASGFLGKRARLPIVGLPAPGDEERIIVDGNARGEILSPPQLESVRGAEAVYVRGRSMEPRYYPGEVVYLHPSRPPNPGDFVFVTLKEPDYPAPIGYIRQYLGADLIHIRLAKFNPRTVYLIARQNLIAMATIVGSGLF